MGCMRVDCAPIRASLGFVEDGEGDTILLLHGSASSGALWRIAAATLKNAYRVVAPDLIGYGKSAQWSSGKPFSLNDECRALKVVLPCCGEKFHLVGYSYGGVVALHLALNNPVVVRSLTLIEPVFFSSLRYAQNMSAYAVFERVRDEFNAALAGSESESATERFIDFWSGAGAWQKLPPGARQDILRIAPKIVLDWKASFAFDPGLERLDLLARRTLLIRGDRSPAPMCELVDAMHTLMPESIRVVLPGANHLLPLTHMPDLVGRVLEHLNAQAERELR